MRGVKRAQVAFEYLFIVAFAFILLTPVIILFYTQQGTVEDEVIGAQAQKVMDELVAAVDTVYYLGPPSKQTLKLRCPKQITSVTLQDDIITFFIQGPGGVYELTGFPAANVTGEIRAYSGVHVLSVQAQGTKVNITEN